MTEFVRFGMTVASTRNGAYHSVGFDVETADWPEIKRNIQVVDADKTVEFREEATPRDNTLGQGWMWVWVVMTNKTSVAVLLHLAELGKGPLPEIKFRSNEYP